MTLRSLLPTLLVLWLFSATPLAQAQTCPANNELVTPNADLVDNGDATVTHLKTGLMWKQCVEGLSGAGCATGTASLYFWPHAQGAALAANVNTFAGYTDWRLPNVKELESIVETGCYTPSINAARFPNTPANYHWTGTTDAANLDYAWNVYFFDGRAMSFAKPNGLFVRLVRGGQPLDAFDLMVDGGCTLDVDANDAQDALTDGLLIIRALFGITGTAVTSGAVGPGARRPTWAQIQPYLNGKCKGTFAP